MINNIFFKQVLIMFSGLLALSLFSYGLSLGFSFSLSEQTPSDKNFLGLILGYFTHVSQLLQGNWGESATRGSQVFNDFFIYFPATLELASAALLFAMLLGIPLGVLAAQNKNKWLDKLVVSTTLVGYSIPIFWWGMLLILLFSVYLGVTPVASRIGFEYDIYPVTGFMLIDTLISEQDYAVEAFWDSLRHLLLPAIALGTTPLAIFTRVTRSAMVEVLSSDYIRTARAKGLSHFRVIWVHALRNAMLPIITVIGLQVSVLITGALITETIFSWPGLGKWLLEAVYRRDYLTIHGGLIAISSLVILTNILVELGSYFINPKQRLPR